MQQWGFCRQQQKVQFIGDSIVVPPDVGDLVLGLYPGLHFGFSHPHSQHMPPGNVLQTCNSPLKGWPVCHLLWLTIASTRNVTVSLSIWSSFADTSAQPRNPWSLCKAATLSKKKGEMEDKDTWSVLTSLFFRSDLFARRRAGIGLPSGSST